MNFTQKQVIKHIENIIDMDKAERIEYFRENILNTIGEIVDKRRSMGAYDEEWETQWWEQYHGITNRVWKVIHRMV